MTKKPNKYSKETKLRLNGQTVRVADFQFTFRGSDSVSWNSELSAVQLRTLVKAFVKSKGNYSADQIQFLDELKNGYHQPVYRAAFKAKGLI